MGCTPDRYSATPGFAFIRPDLILLYPILSGTIERPIYSLAGYRTSTWGYSIQANLLGWIASSIFGLVALGLMFSIAGEFVVLIGTPLFGMVIKMAWFSGVPRDAEKRGALGYFLLATFLSTLTIALLPLWMDLLGTSTWSWAYKTQTLKAIAILVCALSSIVLHINLFVGLKRGGVVADVRRGFEVLPAQGAEPCKTVVATPATD